MALLSPGFGPSVNIAPVNLPVHDTLSKLLIVNLRDVLRALGFYGLKLNPKKLEFGLIGVKVLLPVTVKKHPRSRVPVALTSP